MMNEGDGLARMMLKWATIFLGIALLAGLIGFGGAAGAAGWAAQVLFFVVLTLLVGSLVMHFVRTAPR